VDLAVFFILTYRHFKHLIHITRYITRVFNDCQVITKKLCQVCQQQQSVRAWTRFEYPVRPPRIEHRLRGKKAECEQLNLCLSFHLLIFLLTLLCRRFYCYTLRKWSLSQILLSIVCAIYSVCSVGVQFCQVFYIATSWKSATIFQ